MLRQQGLPPAFSHNVLLRRTRALPLTPPPKPEQLPAWKLVRPRLKKTLPTSELPPRTHALTYFASSFAVSVYI